MCATRNLSGPAFSKSVTAQLSCAGADTPRGLGGNANPIPSLSQKLQLSQRNTTGAGAISVLALFNKRTNYISLYLLPLWRTAVERLMRNKKRKNLETTSTHEEEVVEIELMNL